MFKQKVKLWRPSNERYVRQLMKRVGYRCYQKAKGNFKMFKGFEEKNLEQKVCFLSFFFSYMIHCYFKS